MAPTLESLETEVKNIKDDVTEVKNTMQFMTQFAAKAEVFLGLFEKHIEKQNEINETFSRTITRITTEQESQGSAIAKMQNSLDKFFSTDTINIREAGNKAIKEQFESNQKNITKYGPVLGWIIGGIAIIVEVYRFFATIGPSK